MSHKIFLLLLLLDSTLAAIKMPTYTKVAVALGSSKEKYLQDIEVIDLVSSNTVCNNLPDFPTKGNWPVGGLNFGDVPIICGGDYKEKSCHTLKDGAWTPTAPLSIGRTSSVMSSAAFLSTATDGSKLFISGGKGAPAYTTTEVLTAKGWKTSVEIPVEMSAHCVVRLNATTSMFIGGSNSYQHMAETFFLNGNTKAWSEGPRLDIPRLHHTCGWINSDSQGKKKSVVVIGGYLNDYGFVQVTEVLKDDFSDWQRGPELPIGVFSAAMVEDPSGGIVLIGGSASVYGTREYDTIFRLPHVGPDAKWEEMKQKLSRPRAYHTAFLIPNELTHCGPTHTYYVLELVKTVLINLGQAIFKF